MKRFSVLLGLMMMLLALSACGCEHEFGVWTTKTEATCASEGVQERVCSQCDEVEERAIMMTAHTYGEWTVEKESTCSETGVTSRVCKGCGYKEEQSAELKEHSFDKGKIVTAATCIQSGLKLNTCLNCGASEESVVPVADHTFGKWSTTKQATCTENGAKVRKCAVCEKEETGVITAQHSWQSATCTKAETCAVCGQTRGGVGGHKWKAATSVNPKKCTVCGATEGSALGITIKDMSNSYLIYNSDVVIKENADGTVNFKVECLKSTNPKTSYVKLVGYDSNGNQTFTSVEPTYYLNIVFSYIKYNSVPAATVQIHISDYFG